MFYIVTIAFVKSFLLYSCLPELSENKQGANDKHRNKILLFFSVRNNRFNKTHGIIGTIRYKLTLHN